MKFLICASLISLIGCSSSVPKEASAALAVEIALVQVSPPSGGSVYFAGPTTIDLQLRIANRSDQPVKLRRVELVSQGIGAWSMTPFTRSFNDVIPAGRGRKVDLWVRGSARGSDLDVPVTVRVNVVFDTPLGPLRRLLLQEVGYDSSMVP
jgi:hypothetical protein